MLHELIEKELRMYFTEHSDFHAVYATSDENTLTLYFTEYNPLGSLAVESGNYKGDRQKVQSGLIEKIILPLLNKNHSDVALYVHFPGIESQFIRPSDQKIFVLYSGTEEQRAFKRASSYFDKNYDTLKKNYPDSQLLGLIFDREQETPFILPGDDAYAMRMELIEKYPTCPSRILVKPMTRDDKSDVILIPSNSG